MKDIKIRIINIINEVMNKEFVTINDENGNLIERGMDSVCFIQMVIALESEFDCEIPDEKIMFNSMNTINKITDVISEIIK